MTSKSGIIKLNLREFVDGQAAMQALLAMDIPISTSYKIAKQIRLVENETKPYWDTRKKALEPYSDKDGKVEWPDKETRLKINKELDEILDTEIGIEIKALPVKSLGENMNIAPGILYGAWFLFTD